MLEGIKNCKREYVEWLLKEVTQEGVEYSELITKDAIDLLVGKLVTPLQVKQYLKQAFEQAFEVGQKVVTVDVVEQVLVESLNNARTTTYASGLQLKNTVSAFTSEAGRSALFPRWPASQNSNSRIYGQNIAGGNPSLQLALDVLRVG